MDVNNADKGSFGADKCKEWKNATLLNGWVCFGGEYNPAQYFKDSNGIVWLRGLVRNGSGVIFNLPVGYRPQYRQLHAVCVEDTFGRVDITAAGDVYQVSGSNGWISLDNIAFRAAN